MMVSKEQALNAYLDAAAALERWTPDASEAYVDLLNVATRAHRDCLAAGYTMRELDAAYLAADPRREKYAASIEWRRRENNS